MYDRSDSKYHFVNLTSNHICSCGFDSVEDAIVDIESYKNRGIVSDYYRVDT